MRKKLLKPRPVTPRARGRNAFNGNPINWKPRDAPRVAATRVPCKGGCGNFVSCRQHTNYCQACVNRRRAERIAAADVKRQLVMQQQIEPRTYVIDGIEFQSCWNGRDSLNPESETPGNLGSSLLDSSPLRS